MFKRILVPIDLSDKNLAALEVAFELTSISEASVTLLHVIETIAGASTEEVESFYSGLERSATERTNALLARVSSPTPAIDRRIVYGRRAEKIIQFASDHDIDLIVLSSHRIDPQHPYEGWGTISHKAALLASCTVLLVK